MYKILKMKEIKYTIFYCNECTVSVRTCDYILLCFLAPDPVLEPYPNLVRSGSAKVYN